MTAPPITIGFNPGPQLVDGSMLNALILQINQALSGQGPAEPGNFTTLSASGAVTGAGFTALFASPPAIGGTVRAAGSFTTLAANSGLTVSSGGAAVTGNSTVTGTFGASGTTQLGNGSTDYIQVTGGTGSASIDAVGGSTTVALKLGGKGANGSVQLFAGGAQVFAAQNLSSKAIVTWNVPPTSSAGLATGTLYSNAGVATFA